MRIEARSALRREKIAPKAFLRELEFTLRPVDAKLDTLATPRDTFTENRVVHRLTLTYKLSSPEPGKYAPALPGLTSLVYDASYELAPLMLFDSNKQLIASWDPSDPSPAKV